MTKQSKFSYLAGFMDGEGTFAIVKTFSVQRKPDGTKKRYVVYKLNISVCNTNREVMDWIVLNFGGKVLEGGNAKRKAHYKTRYAWHVTHRHKQKDFILSLLPYLVAKKEQAKIALQFIETYRDEPVYGVTLEPAVVGRREQLRNFMRELNGTLTTDSKPVETTRETPQVEGDDIVRTVQQCAEGDRNDPPTSQLDEEFDWAALQALRTSASNY